MILRVLFLFEIELLDFKMLLGGTHLIYIGTARQRYVEFELVRVSLNDVLRESHPSTATNGENVAVVKRLFVPLKLFGNRFILMSVRSKIFIRKIKNEETLLSLVLL